MRENLAGDRAAEACIREGEREDVNERQWMAAT